MVSQTEVMGQIKRLHINNLLGFKNENIVDFHEEDLCSVSCLNVLVGNSNTGKSRLLQCIQAINILRYHYNILKLENQGVSLERNAQCIGQSNAHSNCESPQSSGQSLLSELVSQKDLPLIFNKTEKQEESIFVVETADGEDRPVYYGLYADAEEEDWAWHVERKHGGHRYSTAFVYCDRNIFIISPNNINQEKIIVKTPCEINFEENLQPLVDNLKTCLGEKAHQKEFLIALPPVIQKYLPSCSISSSRQLANCLPQYRGPDEIPLLMRAILKQEMELPTRCFLLEHPFSLMTEDIRMDKLVRELAKYCKAKKYQIILITQSNRVVMNPSVGSVMRFKKTGQDYLKVAKVPKDTISKCRDEDWALLDFLTFSFILLVEGKCDKNVVYSLFLHCYGEDTQLYEFDAENQSILKKIMEQTYIVKCKGKGNFSGFIDFLLSHPQLGILPYIICDGDALHGDKGDMEGHSVGKKRNKRKKKHELDQNKKLCRSLQAIALEQDGRMEENIAFEYSETGPLETKAAQSRIGESYSEHRNQSDQSNMLKKSKILGVNKSSVIYKCIDHLEKGTGANEIYGKLYDAECSSNTVVRQYLASKRPPPTDGKSKYEDLIEKIHSFHCPEPKHVGDFSEKHLYAFSWKKDGVQCDLESMINITLGSESFTKKSLSEEITDDMAPRLVLEKNPEIRRLLEFMRTHIVELYRQYSPPDLHQLFPRKPNQDKELSHGDSDQKSGLLK